MQDIQKDMTPSNSASELIKDNWFSETESTLWPGQKFALKVEEVLFNAKSDFQDILLFQSTHYGRVLVLDGVIQLTERDEFAYQEMMVHVPLFGLSRAPKKVLIVGGGDGGVLREVVKHPSVEVIHMCEIDRKVVEVSKHFFPNTVATAYDDPRLTMIYGDAAKFLMESGKGADYDCIVVDSSDPVGPAETLYQQEFFNSVKHALAPGGVFCMQGECIWLHLPLIREMLQSCSTVFSSGVVKYAYTTIPSYPSGQIGLLICVNGDDRAESTEALNPAEPSRNVPDGMSLRYYTSDIHRASFVLPAFARDVISSS
mmetsp:Transcript_8961/g.13470  ORF Transcript_8961/g.13470 Transcript_8961/m.13470 type:complete len:314 (-) Transcript_8961:175-1116(-)